MIAFISIKRSIGGGFPRGEDGCILGFCCSRFLWVLIDLGFDIGKEGLALGACFVDSDLSLPLSPPSPYFHIPKWHARDSCRTEPVVGSVDLNTPVWWG